MIHALGLVRPELDHLAPDAWAVYADEEESLSRSGLFESTARFKKTFGVTPAVRVHFVGVWDTVSSFGWIGNLRSTPYAADNPSVDHVRHAVAIDERRALFADNRFYPRKAKHQSIKEVWFAGTHGDAGGGWPEAKSGLAKTTLEWMFREAENEGLLIDSAEKESFLGRSPGRKDRAKPSVECPVNRSLLGLWWLLEAIPRRQWWYTSDGGRMAWFWPHVARRRVIPKNALVHESVVRKLEVDQGYKPSNLPDEYVVEA